MVSEAKGHFRKWPPPCRLPLTARLDPGPRNKLRSPRVYQPIPLRFRLEQDMNKMQGVNSPDSLKSLGRHLPGQVVLVLQGGGALGSYQAGVYQALQEAGIEPDWIIGTSIGAINASLIAGNAPQARLPRLREFWKRMEQSPVWSFRDVFPGFNDRLAYWS